MKKLIILCLFMSLDVNGAQPGSLAHTLITGQEVLITEQDYDSFETRANNAVPDLRGYYELESFYVVFANGSTSSSENVSTSGIMSITTHSFFQGMTVSDNSIIAAGTYAQTNDSLTFNNMGLNISTLATYTWDGEHLKTYTSNSYFNETDKWVRVEDYSGDNGSTQAGIAQCKTDPSSCGISTESNDDGSTSEGITQCQNNPSSCGISAVSNDDVPVGMVDASLNISIPSLNYITFTGTQNIWLDLIFSHEENNKIYWTLKDFGVNQ